MNDWINTKAAAEYAGCTPITIVRWIKRFDIGYRRAGRWVVSFDALQALLAIPPNIGEVLDDGS